MSQFDDRKDAFEKKFAHDAEMKFKAEARRNKFLGHWAAALLDKEADAYASEVIKADFQEAGDEDVFRKLTTDLNGLVTDEEIRSKMAELLVKAKDEIMHEA